MVQQEKSSDSESPYFSKQGNKYDIYFYKNIHLKNQILLKNL